MVENGCFQRQHFRFTILRGNSGELHTYWVALGIELDVVQVLVDLQVEWVDGCLRVWLRVWLFRLAFDVAISSWPSLWGFPLTISCCQFLWACHI